MIVTTARTPYMRKRKAAFLTVGRQKSQTSAFDANQWKAMIQKIHLVWSRVVGSRFVGSQAVGSWIVSRHLASRPLVSQPLASRCLTSLPPASSWSQVVGSWCRWIPKRCGPHFRRRKCVKSARLRQLWASSIPFVIPLFNVVQSWFFLEPSTLPPGLKV